MQKPETLEAFKTLIDSMEHRERFVFAASDESKGMNEDIDSIEIYTTKLYEQSTFSNGLDTNVKVSFVDVCGKQLKGSAYCISKYLRLWSPSFYAKTFSYIS